MDVIVGRGGEVAKEARVCQVKELLQGDVLVPGRDPFGGVLREGRG